jgi:pimeloyl-ACP methyl ester carboxylesterase
MKQKLTLLASFLSLFTFAQTGTEQIIQENPDLGAEVDYILENLDMSPVTTDILIDAGFVMNDLNGLDGTSSADTLSSWDDWIASFMTLRTGVLTGTSPIGEIADWETNVIQLIESDVIPIMGIAADYHQFLEDSVLLSTRIIEVDGQLYDTWSGSNTPYDEKEIVAWGPYKSRVFDELTHTFRFESNFYVSNWWSNIATLEIDFDNGQGYQTLSPGTDKAVSWTSYGKKVFKTKVTYTNASVEYGYADFTLVDRYAGTGTSSLAKYNSSADDVVFVPHPTMSNHGLDMYIEYACFGQEKLIKPFIYVEGFNPPEFEESELTYRKFYNKLNAYENNPGNNASYQLLTELQNNGYDIVYIDFRKGSGDLIENAKSLAAAINKINTELKAYHGDAYNSVVVGESMGGVVARLALTYMEDDAEDHEVSYYVSVDSPHRGANIPRAIIAALIDVRNYHFADFDVSEDVPEVEEAYQVLFSPAARQMLLYSGEGSNTLITGHGPTFNSFQHHLHNEQGMPTQTLTIKKALFCINRSEF